jgi:superfamily II DNA or RNA helicase
MWLDADDDRESCADDASGGAQFLPPGTIVISRGERWRIHACIRHADCAEVHLTNATGSTVLLSPIDRFRLIESASLVRAVRLRRWAARLREHATGVRAGSLRVDHVRARILPYQLAPALAVAAGHPRLLLADEVGLGKTIQAGWIIADAIGRNADARILVVVPAGLKRQWHAELSVHFGIDAVVSDARWLRRTAADLPGDVNPWSLPGVYLTSLDFIKRTEVARSLDHQVWDVLAVDEVHTAASPTDRYRALSLLARRARCVVTISATPFSGDQHSLASIAGLGAAPGDTPPLMFRRSRQEAAVTGRRRHRFGVVAISRAEQRLQRLLERYSRLVWRHAPGDLDAVRLAMTVLRKRALSSPIAAQRSLDRRLHFLANAAPVPTQLALFDADEDPLDDDEPAGVLAPPGMHDANLERRWLVALIDAARHAARFDSKRAFLQRLMRRIRQDSAIVFTEYRDTLTHLAGAFPDALLLHGGLSADQREAVRTRFNVSGGLLLATDAAADGLNLQGRCRLVVNYELPWNPARLEQRIGRVDRIGQQRPVHALTLVARDTAEQLVLARLTRRLHRIAATLGERDRLTAFLGEARVAGLIIGGILAETSEDQGPQPALERAPDHEDRTSAEAARLLGLAKVPTDSSICADIPVSIIQPRKGLDGGFVFVVRWSATTRDGQSIDNDIRLIHVEDRALFPCRTAAHARRAAIGAIERHRDAVLRACDRWAASCLDRAVSVHAVSTARLLDRERFLRSISGPERLFQPGLFDRRAVHHADESHHARTAVEREHDRRIESLERSTTLEGRHQIAAVLIVTMARG